jgi:hypothetical protein
VILEARRPPRERADKRRAVPLELPEPTAPSPSDSIPGKKRQRKQEKKAASPVADLTPEELAAGVSRQQQEDLFKLADRKVEAAEAWRSVGAAVLSAANRQFAALKSDPWRTQLFAKSSVKVGPVKMAFAKELFDVSIDTMLPKMAERQSKAAGLKASSGAMTVSFTPKRRPAPAAVELDKERPGYSAFREAKLMEDMPSDGTDATSEAGSSTLTPIRTTKRLALDEEGEEELQAEWDSQLTDEERAQYKAIEEQRSAESNRQISAWEAEQSAPKTAYAVQLREPQIASQLLRLPKQWKAFEYVSVAGHQVQNAQLTKLHLNYDIATQQLTIDCTVSNGSEE